MTAIVEAHAAYAMQALDLSQAYAGHTVLDRLKLIVEPGQVLGLVGRNGAGKSTLLRLLLGLTQPQTGQAWVFGDPALKLSDAVKQRISYVPQQPDAMAWLSAGQLMDFVGRFYPRWDAAYAQDTLQRWNIDTNKLMAKLSPGERQRVDLVRALASQPELLVLDEPAAALDPVARRELLREIALRAGEAGTTVVFSTHIVSDLERVASHIAFLHQGRLLLHCPVDDTKERYARLWLPPRFASVIGEIPALSHRRHADGSSSLVIECDEDQHWHQAVTLEGARLDVLGLEDLFVEIAE
ncbi:ABC transporter ATP-binding protein [Frateuria aurantia]|uniref:ABC-type multidrug transport system, ATPase component n=1 Tax=Frateuria aurantia (strain ATCC 33424 / DSM 6220 / KCTC 2777 / LMG 1558 / NBRC 3245 / NCIMB 13370) TaxID=767434 RepID=H8KZ36_FRAAD|nr:ABC transporter ATP-binding protein [Frateuria aurantia]AFC84527.1 ABC-type multidrug transport system, ATPase component [Frateuria aurantia DSM 6220]